MNKALKSVEKVLSGTHCKLCLCVLLVGMILYILNRFTFGGRNEGFLNALSMDRQKGLSNRAENEYRRVKLKYGKKKLRKMGLDPGKYSEDFIFAIKITLGEVFATITAKANIYGEAYSQDNAFNVADSPVSSLTDLQGAIRGDNIPNNSIGKVSSSSIDIHYLVIGVKAAAASNNNTGMIGLGEAIWLYGNGASLTFRLGANKSTSPTAPIATGAHQYIHGFNSDCISPKKTASGTETYDVAANTCTASNYDPIAPTDSSMDITNQYIAADKASTMCKLCAYQSTSTAFDGYINAYSSALNTRGDKLTMGNSMTIYTGGALGSGITSIGSDAAQLAAYIKTLSDSTISSSGKIDIASIGGAAVFLYEIDVSTLKTSFLQEDLDVVFELLA